MTGVPRPDEAERRRQARFCIDCARWVEPYMLLDRVWFEAVPNYALLKRARAHVCVCLECVEMRLARSLRIDDFTHAPINALLRVGFRLGQRAALSLRRR